jgi:hypothetical protein
MLDTEGGSPAELVYPKLGYIRVSSIFRHDILILKMIYSIGGSYSGRHDFPCKFIVEGCNFILQKFAK